MLYGWTHTRGIGGPPLDDDFWHVTKYYDNIRQKVKNLDHSLGSCYGFGAMHIPARVCNTVMKVRVILCEMGKIDTFVSKPEA